MQVPGQLAPASLGLVPSLLDTWKITFHGQHLDLGGLGKTPCRVTRWVFSEPNLDLVRSRWVGYCENGSWRWEKLRVPRHRDPWP